MRRSSLGLACVHIMVASLSVTAHLLLRVYNNGWQLTTSGSTMDLKILR